MRSPTLLCHLVHQVVLGVWLLVLVVLFQEEDPGPRFGFQALWPFSRFICCVLGFSAKASSIASVIERMRSGKVVNSGPLLYESSTPSFSYLRRELVLVTCFAPWRNLSRPPSACGTLPHWVQHSHNIKDFILLHIVFDNSIFLDWIYRALYFVFSKSICVWAALNLVVAPLQTYIYLLCLVIIT